MVIIEQSLLYGKKQPNVLTQLMNLDDNSKGGRCEAGEN